MTPQPNQVPSHKLLLLSSISSSSCPHSFRTAYGPALALVLTQAAKESTPELPCGVDIAVLCNDLHKQGYQAPRKTTFTVLQNIIAGIYRLIVHVCAEEGIDLDRGDQIDPRVLVVAEDLDGMRDDEGNAEYVPQGPVVTLRTLASSTRAWKSVYAPDGDDGERILREFTTARRNSQERTLPFEVIRVPRNSEAGLSGSNILPQETDGQRHYSVAVGGTFDHLHLGHRLLLTATALALDPPPNYRHRDRCIVIGITGDALLREKKYSENLESWDTRQEAVYRFLCGIMVFHKSHAVSIERHSGPGPNENGVNYSFEDGLVIKCVEISDPFGPTITDESISAMAISGETRSGGRAVNDKRVEKDWAPLELFEVDVLDANSEQETSSSSNFQSKLSSSEIRKRLQQKSTSNL